MKKAPCGDTLVVSRSPWGPHAKARLWHPTGATGGPERNY
jgi:hypothetical protein